MKTWGRTDILKLLDSVEKREVLWNSTLPSYKNSLIKQKAWSGVTKELDGFDHKKVKQKFYHLVRRYKQEVQELKIKEIQGLPYCPKSPWFNRMYSFLGDIPLASQLMNNDDYDTESQDEIMTFDHKQLEAEHSGEPDVQILRQILATPNIQPINRSGRKSPAELCEEDSLEKACEAFGQSVAVQLKELSFIRSMEVQMKIQSLLTEELIKDRQGKVKHK